jgi:hypothetical protein
VGKRTKLGEDQMSAEIDRDITAVLLRYATGIDQRDWRLFASCFTAGMEADYGCIGKWHGRDAFVSFMQDGHLKVGPTMHRMTNIVVIVAEDRATATSYVDALLLPAQAGGSVRQAHGRYEDELVRVEGQWKISSRRFIAVLIAECPA